MSHHTFIHQMHADLDNAGLDAPSWEIRSFPTIGSTSSRVFDMLGLYPKVIVMALSQSQGRGRQSNVWYSPVGGLWISFGFELNSKVIELSEPLIDTVYRLLEPHVEGLKVKLPNDLLIQGKKVCGLLVETKIRNNRLNQIVVGVGINISNDIPEEVQDSATRLVDHNYAPDIYSLGSKIVVECFKTLTRVLNL